MNFDFNKLAQDTAGLNPLDWKFDGVKLNVHEDEGWTTPVAVFVSVRPGSTERRVFDRRALMRQIALEAAAGENPEAESFLDVLMAAQDRLVSFTRVEMQKGILGSSGRGDFKFACVEEVTEGPFIPVTLHECADRRSAFAVCLLLSRAEIVSCRKAMQDYLEGSRHLSPEKMAYFMPEVRRNFEELSGGNPAMSLRTAVRPDFPPEVRRL